MGLLLPSLKYALRSLARNLGFTALCVSTLAVGVASVTAVFSVVDGVLLDPLPYPEADRLVMISHVAPGLQAGPLPQSPATYLLYRESSRYLEEIALFRRSEANLTDESEPERLTVGEVTPSLFSVLRTSPQLGRTFSERHGYPGSDPVVILSDSLWRRRYGGNPGVVGSRILLEDRPVEVLGVLPEGFELLRPDIDLWRPLPVDPVTADLGAFGPLGVARLAPGATLEQAEADLDRLLSDLTERFPASDAAPVLASAGFSAELSPLREEITGAVDGMLWILLGSTGIVLLIAIANVGNLLLVRSELRQRTRTLQMALGASPGRAVFTVLAETLVLSLMAGLIGVALAWGALRLLLRWRPTTIPRLDEIGLDGSVLLFVVAVVLITSVLAGVLPALRSRTGDLASALRTESVGPTVAEGRLARRWRRVLVVGQVALAFVLMIAAGLFLRSFLRVSDVDLGFRGEDVIALELSLTGARYPDDASVSRFADRILEGVGALPGVSKVAITTSLPLSGSDWGAAHQIEGTVAPPGAPPPVVFFSNVSAEYFQVMGMPVLEGRGLRAEDRHGGAGAVVVSETLARHFWPDVDPIGRRMRPASDDPDARWYTVVGVVGDVRHRRPTDPPLPRAYYPLPGRTPHPLSGRSLAVAVRTAGPPELAMVPVREQIRSLDPRLPVQDLETMGSRVERANSRMSFTVLFVVLGTAVAAILGIVGLYAFISYLVSQRTAEIGVRMTLGADRRRIRGMVFRESLFTALAGAATGLAGAFALTRSLESLLYEVSPLDPLTFVVVPVLLVILTSAATLVPAVRAARLDPAEAAHRAA